MISEEAVAHVAASLGVSTNRARRLAHTALPAGFVRQVTGRPWVLLVEGPTDVAVFAALWDSPADPVVVAAGGKHVFRLATAVARAHGCTVTVVLDGDSGRFRAHRASARVLAELADLDADLEVHVLPVDLEHAVTGWGSFVEALQRNGSELGVKDPLAYGTAARAASAADLPPLLATLSTAVAQRRRWR